MSVDALQPGDYHCGSRRHCIKKGMKWGTTKTVSVNSAVFHPIIAFDILKSMNFTSDASGQCIFAIDAKSAESGK